ncbi:serine/threonine-protein kinase [Actinomadura sp. 9N215]|uniref:serine/threonine-protein kinase n=1 Tax=Actinomadura sp. 9N215 TaxID=3375150 RepID=UPI0037ABA750
MQAPLRDRDPQRLGPYRLAGRLGRGGMGTVFLGEDGAGRQVAVKVINAELADDEAFHERFRREVTAARQVSRFCTAAVLDARLDGEPLYVVTEYVAGPSLEAAVKQGGPLRGGDLEALAVNIATALGAIHGAGIVHRDLKPSNVLLSPTGPRVIDFGIARALDSSDGPTRTGQFVGTPAYIAPELMHGREITPAADVFSWGCVVAYAGTGRVPFSGGTLPEVINRVTTGDPDLDGLDPAVRALVARALAKKPAERPTVKQLIQALTGEDEPPATPVAPAPPQNDAPPPPPAPESGRPPERGTVPQTTVDPVPVTRPVNAPPPSAPPARSPAGRSAGRTAGRLAGRPLKQRRLLIAALSAVGVVVPILAGLLAPGPDRTPNDSAAASSSGFGEKPPEPEQKLYADNFSDETSGWKRAATSNVFWEAAYLDRKYEVHVLPAAKQNVIGAPVSPPASMSHLIEVEVEPGGDGEAGVYCRGTRSGFAFLLRSDGRARIVAMEGGEPRRQLVTGAAGDLSENDDLIHAACVPDGPSMRLGMWVNDELVTSATAPAPTGGDGGIGLLVTSPDGATREATFDNFSLCEL